MTNELLYSDPKALSRQIIYGAIEHRGQGGPLVSILSMCTLFYMRSNRIRTIAKYFYLSGCAYVYQFLHGSLIRFFWILITGSISPCKIFLMALRYSGLCFCSRVTRTWYWYQIFALETAAGYLLLVKGHHWPHCKPDPLRLSYPLGNEDRDGYLEIVFSSLCTVIEKKLIEWVMYP